MQEIGFEQDPEQAEKARTQASQRLLWLLSVYHTVHPEKSTRFCFTGDGWGILEDGITMQHARYLGGLLALEKEILGQCENYLKKSVDAILVPAAFTSEGVEELEEYYMGILDRRYIVDPDEVMLVFDQMEGDRLLCGIVCREKLEGELMDSSELFEMVNRQFSAVD